MTPDACPLCERPLKGQGEGFPGALSEDGTMVWCCTSCGAAAPRLCPARRDHWLIAMPCGHQQPRGLDLVPVEDFIARSAARSPSPTGTRAHLKRLLYRAQFSYPMTDYDQLPPDEQARLRAEWAEQMTARRLALRFDEPEDEDEDEDEEDGDNA